MESGFSLEPAIINDVAALVCLVNEAYRGEKSWTTEIKLVHGDRSTTEEIRSLIEQINTHLLVLRDASGLIACICIEEKEGKAYLGTFAVNPAHQNQGIGKQVLGMAEEYASNVLGLCQLSMLVISQREELISFYERRGYKRLGIIQAFPVHLNVGVPLQEGLTIEHLEKFV